MPDGIAVRRRGRKANALRRGECQRPGGVRPREGRYAGVMRAAFTVIIVLLMLGTLGVLVAGMFGMVRGDADPARSNRLMRWRVILQGAALLMLLILMSQLRP